MSTLDYHVVALRAPLRKGEDGMFHVVLPDIPDNLTMHVGEAFLDYEFDNGFVTLVFTESQEHVDEQPEEPVKPKLEIVTNA